MKLLTSASRRPRSAVRRYPHGYPADEGLVRASSPLELAVVDKLHPGNGALPPQRSTPTQGGRGGQIAPFAYWHLRPTGRKLCIV